MTFQPRPNHPYADAPRLPDTAEVRLDEVVPGTGPIEIEIGSGRGGFVFERAAASPEARIIGIEIRLKWASLVDGRLNKAGLGARARVFNGDAREVLSRVVPDASIARFFMHFPDPWWKKRHAKRLVMGAQLLDHVARLLVDGGEFFVQTDVDERAGLYDEQLGAHPDLAPWGDVEGSSRLVENPYGARSPREHHAIADGLPIYRLRYRRRPRAAG